MFVFWVNVCRYVCVCMCVCVCLCVCGYVCVKELGVVLYVLGVIECVGHAGILLFFWKLHKHFICGCVLVCGCV